LNREVGGLLALENAIYIASREPELIDKISAIADQAADIDISAEAIDCRQFVLGASATIKSR
jgi:hypothetical protein